MDVYLQIAMAINDEIDKFIDSSPNIIHGSLIKNKIHDIVEKNLTTDEPSRSLSDQLLVDLNDKIIDMGDNNDLRVGHGVQLILKSIRRYVSKLVLKELKGNKP